MSSSHWNRSARRSGGYKPRPLIVAPQRPTAERRKVLEAARPMHPTRDLADALRRAQQLIASDPDAAVLVEDAETGDVFTIDRHCVARIEVTEPRRQVRAYHLVRKAP